MFSVARFGQQSRIFKKLCDILHQHDFITNRSYCAYTLYQLKCNSNPISSHYRWYSSKTQSEQQNDQQTLKQLFDFQHEWPADIKDEFLQDMILIEDFVTETEEQRLYAEAQKTMKRMRYQYDHWDNAIHGYREMEKTDWLPDNEQVFQRVRDKAFVSNVLPHVHILDLAADGIIKPHVDSSRYCGSTIAGLSLLTDCIMRLKRVDEKMYEQNKLQDDQNIAPEYTRADRKIDDSKNDESNELNYFVDILLKRRSLYIMKDSARYKFSHEVLATHSKFLGKEITKERRISIICRNQA